MHHFSTALGVCLIVAVASNWAEANTHAAAQTSVSPRIVGGVPTAIAQVPATVALLRSSQVEMDGDLFKAQFCGGTVIAPRWVLTAAHCVVTATGTVVTPDSVLVLTGSDDLESPVNQPISVSAIITHPEYRSVEQGSDIALVHLEYDSLVQPAPVNTESIGIDERAFIAGWGAINSRDDGRSQSFPKKLRGAFVNVNSGTTCSARFPEYRDYTNETNLCAGVMEGGKDSCQGDSGGPLYRVDSTQNRITAITGITSWGISCGLADNPGIYTNVASYVDWVRSSMQLIEPQPQLALSPPPVEELADEELNSQPTVLPPSDDREPTQIANDGASVNAPANFANEDEHVLGITSWNTLLALFIFLMLRRRSR